MLTNPDTLAINRTNFAVFFEKERLQDTGDVAWREQFFGFEHEPPAFALFQLLQLATNHVSVRTHGFRNLRLCAKNDGVWRTVHLFPDGGL